MYIFVLTISLYLYVSIVIIPLLGLLGMYPSASRGLNFGMWQSTIHNFDLAICLGIESKEIQIQKISKVSSKN